MSDIPSLPALELDDQMLALRAGDGDLRAFEILLRRHQQPMYRLALKVLGDPLDAEDAVQEAFVSAWRQLRQFRAEAAFGTWLYRIVTNRCLNQARTRTRHPTVAFDGEERTVATTVSGSPEHLAEIDAEMEALDRAVRTLPMDQRICWVLRENDGLGYVEIAEIVGATPDAVRGRIHRARQELAHSMRSWR